MGRDHQNKFPDMFSPCLRDVLKCFELFLVLLRAR